MRFIAKKTAAIVLAAVFVMGAGLIGAARWYETYLERQLEETIFRLPFPAQVGKVEISLWQGAIVLQDIQGTVPLDGGQASFSVEKASAGGVRILSLGKRETTPLADGVLLNGIRMSISQQGVYARLSLKSVSLGGVSAAPGLFSDPASTAAGVHSITLRSGWFFHLDGTVNADTGVQPREGAIVLAPGMPVTAAPLPLVGPNADWEEVFRSRLRALQLALAEGAGFSVELMRFDSLSSTKVEKVSLSNIRATASGESLLSADTVFCERLEYPALLLGIPLTGVRGLAVEGAAWRDPGGTVSLARAELNAALSLTEATASLSVQGLSMPPSLLPFAEGSLGGSAPGRDTPIRRGMHYVPGNTDVSLSLEAELGLPQKGTAGKTFLPWRSKKFSLAVGQDRAFKGVAQGILHAPPECSLVVTAVDAVAETPAGIIPRVYEGEPVPFNQHVLRWLAGEEDPLSP